MNFVRPATTVTEDNFSDREEDVSSWSRGRAVNMVRPTDAIVDEDCSLWDAEPVDGPTVTLELRFRPNGRHDAKVYGDYAKQLVQEIRLLDPSLGLTYDTARSHVETDEVIVVLTPGAVDQPAVRLAQLSDRIRELLRRKPTGPLTLAEQKLNVQEDHPKTLAA